MKYIFLILLSFGCSSQAMREVTAQDRFDHLRWQTIVDGFYVSKLHKFDGKNGKTVMKTVEVKSARIFGKTLKPFTVYVISRRDGQFNNAVFTGYYGYETTDDKNLPYSMVVEELDPDFTQRVYTSLLDQHTTQQIELQKKSPEETEE